MFKINENQTVEDENGKVLYFGLEDFKSRIIKGSDCFICGADPMKVKFNDEHIIPNWILKRFNIHNKSISLPNGASIKYGQYKVPCCVSCNSQLSVEYEKPISELFSKSYLEATTMLSEKPDLYTVIFKWLNLMFLKTHLKDTELRMDLDMRKSKGFIGDYHYWEDIHHIHCIARSHYSNAIIDDEVFGTVFIFETLIRDPSDHFNYMDSVVGKVVLIQIGFFTIMTVLNDACAAYSCYRHLLDKITGPLTILQSRQIFSDFNFININLKKRPKFVSNFTDKGYYIIDVELPSKPELLEEDKQLIKAPEILAFYIDRVLDTNLENRDEIIEAIREGKGNYLWDDDGNFMDRSK